MKEAYRRQVEAAQERAAKKAQAAVKEIEESRAMQEELDARMVEHEQNREVNLQQLKEERDDYHKSIAGRTEIRRELEEAKNYDDLNYYVRQAERANKSLMKVTKKNAKDLKERTEKHKEKIQMVRTTRKEIGLELQEKREIVKEKLNEIDG